MQDAQDTMPMAEAWPAAARIVRQPGTGRLLVDTGKVAIGRLHRRPGSVGSAIYAYRAPMNWWSIILSAGAAALAVAGGVLVGYM